MATTTDQISTHKNQIIIKKNDNIMNIFNISTCIFGGKQVNTQIHIIVIMDQTKTREHPMKCFECNMMTAFPHRFPVQPVLPQHVSLKDFFLVRNLFNNRITSLISISKLVFNNY